MRAWFAVLLVVVAVEVGAQSRLVLETAENLRPFAGVLASRLREAGITADIRFAPAARLVEDLNQGTIDGAFFVTERAIASSEIYALIPVPLYQNDYVAVTLPGQPPIRRVSDLATRTVAFARGNTSLVALGQNGGEVHPTIDEEQAFRLLGANRVQVVLASRTSVQLFGSAAGQTLFIHEPPLLSSPLFLCLRQSLNGAREAITRTLRASVDDGSWARDIRAVISGFSSR